MNRPVAALALTSLSLFLPGLPGSALARPAVETARSHSGHPSVKLDRLDLSRVPLTVAEEKYLRKVLSREADSADWGVGRGAHVEYRFRLDELSVVESTGVVRVQCSATGWLPKSRSAKSRLSFGGSPKDRAKLVEHVLEIVARGVVTRLADLERRRRGSAAAR